MRRRRSKRNGAGSAVLGFIAGAILPPLGLGSAFAGYRPGTFWAGASWGGGIAAGLGLASLALSRKAAGSGLQQIGARAKVGDFVTANFVGATAAGGITFAGAVRVQITAIDASGEGMQGTIQDPKLGAGATNALVSFTRSSIIAVG